MHPFEVHKFLGNGFQELIYQRALAWELAQAGLSYAREIEQAIFYKELQEPIGTRRADFVVEGKNFSGAKSNHRIGRCPPCPNFKLP